MDFPTILKIILKNEGGYVNDKDDYGGETFCGISRIGWPKEVIWFMIDNYKPLFLNNIIPNGEKFKNDIILETHVFNFYYRNYFLRLKINTINDPKLAIHVLDTSLGGSVGERLLKTIYNTNSMENAIELANLDQTALQKFIEARTIYYKKAALVKNQKKFLKGWLNRVDYVCKLTGSMTFDTNMRYLVSPFQPLFDKLDFKKICSTCSTN